jgi:hypothetical protein
MKYRDGRPGSNIGIEAQGPGAMHIPMPGFWRID